MTENGYCTARRRLIGAALLALPLLLAANGAPAQGWKAEWDRTVAAAKAEGRLLLGAPRSPGMRKSVTVVWEKEFPEIKLNWVPAGGGDWPNRIQTERRAGKYLWDVYFAGPATSAYKMADRIFQPMRPLMFVPGVKDPAVWGGWDSAFVDRQGKYMLAIWEYIATPFYNSKFVSPEKVKRLGFKVMLEPQYKGKIAWQDPRGRGPGQNVAALIYHAIGRDAFKRVIVDQKSVFYRRSAQVAEAVIREKAVFALTGNFLEDLKPYVGAGMDVSQIKPFGNTAKTAYLSIGGMVLAAFDKAPHPNATKLFVNWVLTKRIQGTLSPMIKTDSRRRDVPRFYKEPFVKQPGEKYVTLQRADEVDFRSGVQKQIRKWRP